MTLITVIPAAELPLTLAEAKKHLEIEHASDNDLITAQIDAATRLAQVKTNRQLVSATFDYKLDRFAATIRIPRPPLTSITSIKYIDTDGNEQTVDPSIYTVEPDSVPGLVRLAYNETWPSTRLEAEPITIRFVAGYTDAASVPEGIKRWMLFQVGDMHNNREQNIIGAGTAVFKFVDALIDAYTVPELA